MAYTICDANGRCKPLRLIVPDVNGTPALKEPFTPHWWVCDPCNPSHSRYEVTYEKGYNPQPMAWYEVVIVTDDGPEDVEIKLEHYRRVQAARAAMDAAEREYKNLTGLRFR